MELRTHDFTKYSRLNDEAGKHLANQSREKEPTCQLDNREELVRKAIRDNDILKLREISVLPGGFNAARKQAWPYLLGIDYEEVLASTEDLSNQDEASEEQANSPQLSGSYASLPSSDALSASLDVSDISRETSRFLRDGENLPAHPDEHQVQLDTDRSFVLYPVESRSMVQRKHLQDDLHDVILGVLRKRSTLRYFQGYHDIISVLFLSLPAKLVLPCAEKLSLHRLRDSMGHGLEPLIGQLRVLKRLLRLIDPEYAAMLEKNSAIPYYALSNLLTLFAHDVPTLPLIQHIYDWLFCREPVASIWLAAAIILHKKEEVLELEKEGDEAMGMNLNMNLYP
ncbi:hypothetical protein M422DRAFT_266091 [Sphaerobolus stellatus SS14]|uniref:Rab-GAP TBC domain-containing protein n=1 Tax=Sphaerobolus stellatus (strain SS14) TaxID=990650 RepID=A0A0C9UBX8_SPHS4|nr:hypothetical protein M422DRAFT_266091 [Sphaerobolus stellatus SS14]